MLGHPPRLAQDGSALVCHRVSNVDPVQRRVDPSRGWFLVGSRSGWVAEGESGSAVQGVFECAGRMAGLVFGR